MRGALAPMAQRVQNAHEGLVQNLAALGGLTDAEARKAATYYIRHRIVKLDTGVGRYTVSHGWYFEADVIRRAVEA